MTCAEWFVLIGADGTVHGVDGGAPLAWLGQRIRELEDAPPALKDAHREITRALWTRETHACASRVVPLDEATHARVVVILAIPLGHLRTDLGGLLTSALTILEPQAAHRDVGLKLHVDDALPTNVLVDPEKIAWAVTTLVGNALRHVRSGTRRLPGGAIDVSVRHDADTSEIVIEVRDDGGGIPKERLPFLFHRPPGKGHAVGLSLHLVNDVVVAHGGSVTLESSTEPFASGTKIELRLPAVR
jgi:signal transduction histidine kinase